MILSVLLAFPQLVPPANTPLYDHKQTSRPEFAVVSAPSVNGQYVFQASGTELIVLDALGVQACANAGGGGAGCNIDALNAGLSRTIVDASILDIEERGQNVFIAGGDYGLIVLGPIGGNGYVNGYTEIFRDASFPAGSITGRWCMDVSVKNGAIVAVFSGLDDSEVRVYNTANPPVLQNIYPLGVAQGIPSPSMAFAVEFASNRAYIAMGRAGVYAVDTTKDPNPLVNPTSAWLFEGPLDTGDSSCTSSTPNSRFVGDLALVSVGETQRYLYAAADSWGLVEIDLSNQAWGTTMGFWYSNPPCYWDSLPLTNCSSGVSVYHYAQRVDAVLDPSHNQVVIALTSTTGSPEYGHMITPFTTYGTLGWDLGAPVPAVPESQVACKGNYHLFTRRASLPGTPPVENVAAQHEPFFQFSTPVYLMKDAAGDHAWLLDAALYVVHYQRTAGTLQKVSVLAGGLHLAVSSPMSPIPALLNPDVVLAGDDGIAGIESVGLYEIQPIGGGVDFVEIPPPLSDPGLFQTSILGTAQWIDSAFPATHEFFLRGKGMVGNPAPLNLWRLDASSPTALQSLTRYSVEWEVDPSSVGNNWTFPEGRGYCSTAVDEQQGSNLIAETRSMAIHGAWLFDREQFRLLASQVGPGGHIDPTNNAPLLSHPEADPIEYEEEVRRTFSMQPQFFDINAGGPIKRVLGVAAGFSVGPNDPAFEHAQVMFHDVTGVLTPSQLTGQPPTRRLNSNAVAPAAAVCLDAATVRLNDPANPGQKKRRTFVFVGGTEGLLTAFDVSDGLFTGAAIPETAFPLPTDVFDGHADVVITLDFQPSVSGNRVGYLHVGAMRLGVVRYIVEDNGNGGLTLTFDGGFNTPGSFGGFYIDTVNDKERLILADHFYYGLRAYGDY
jgi:hypothetical protein